MSHIDESHLLANIEITDADVAENNLPQCKIKRNYSCALCPFFSQNPRSFLYHSRDVHNDKIKVYECSQCLYASKHSQKLQRHINMIHVAGNKPRKIPVRKAVEKRQRPVALVSPLNHTEEDEDGNVIQVIDVKTDGEFKCSVCNFTSRSDLLIRRHERLVHLKKRFFRCTKCSYVTHVKARFTKHVKYHSMPMIKCTICDFRTPYKWNLDRHYKNHSGSGTFQCTKCNFRADIKQSLTVHEMNHHVPPVGQGALMLRRRNKVGATDIHCEPLDMDDLELLRLESEDMDLDEGEDGMCEEPDINADEEFQLKSNHSSPTQPPSTSNKQANCKICNFEATDIRDVWRHERSVHNFIRIESKLEGKTRPPPQLIPIQTKPTSPKLVMENKNEIVDDEQFTALCKKSSLTSSLKNFVSLIGDEEALKSIPDADTNDEEPLEKKVCLDEDLKKQQTDFLKKKNASFFEQLKEKIVNRSGEEGQLICITCGHESKCLSESVAHEKKHTDDIVKSDETNNSVPEAELSSTRCQHCRQRCKTSTDLINHFKTCKAFGVAYGTHHLDEEGDDNSEETTENRVFVWNNIDQPNLEKDDELDVEPETELTVATPSEIKTTIRQGLKKVFKCPHCSFWASTASRFHVHIVGHLNKKPFECSLCYYRSNWRWDITKHIRLKSARDPGHLNASVNMTDETGRRNYSKYNKYLTMMKVPEIHADSSGTGRRTRSVEATQGLLSDQDVIQPIPAPPQLKRAPIPGTAYSVPEDAVLKPPPLLHLAQSNAVASKRTLWKCKKCQYRNSNKNLVLAHVKEHYDEKKKSDPSTSQESIREVSSNENSESNDVPDSQSAEIACDICPFTTQNEGDLTAHKLNHIDRPGSIFKCTYCPFYVPSKIAVLEHMEIHGVEPSFRPYFSKTISANASSNNNNILQGPPAEQKRHRCKQCPYVTNSRNHFLYHKQFHRPRNAPFKCLQCSYNVTRRHLLQQHVRVHYNEQQKIIETNSTPTTPDEDLTEIPLVWVFRGGSYLKMFKCRWCPHVNMRKISVQEHEKLHLENTSMQLTCPHCSFATDSSVQLLNHVKVHDDENGIKSLVDPNQSDKEQIEVLQQSSLVEPEVVLKIDETDPTPESTYYQTTQEDFLQNDDSGYVHFCLRCPARFLSKKELQIHAKFHLVRLPFKCDYCSYTVRQRPHLLAHLKVHGKDYQDRTENLLDHYQVSPENPQPVLTKTGAKDEPVWVVKPKQEKILKAPVKHSCSQCPATFFKTVALQYHLTLHGSNNKHKCKFCTYAVKNYGNLTKHQLVHEETKIVKKSKVRFRCHKCPTGFEKLERFTIHLSLHGAKNRYTCPTCDYSVKFYANFIQHVKKHEKTDIDGVKKYPCPKCPFSSFEKSELDKHIKFHGTKIGQKCPHCDFWSTNLSDHLKIHFVCDEKPKAYLTPGPLEIWCTDFENNITHKVFWDKGEGEPDRFGPKTDENFFVKDKTYVNPTTGEIVSPGEEYELLSNGEFKVIDRVKLKLKDKFECSKCPQKFSRKDNLLYHEKHHGANFENTCHLCDYSVKYRTKFFKHLEWHKNNHELDDGLPINLVEATLEEVEGGS